MERQADEEDGDHGEDAKDKTDHSATGLGSVLDTGNGHDGASRL
jgi:hypothetical protein